MGGLLKILSIEEPLKNLLNVILERSEGSPGEQNQSFIYERFFIYIQNDGFSEIP